MKQVYALVLLVLCSGIVLVAQPKGNFKSDELIMKLKDHSDFEDLTYNIGNSRLKRLVEKFPCKINKVYHQRALQEASVIHVNFQDKQDLFSLANAYMETGLFEYVEPNYIGYGGGQQHVMANNPDDTYYSRQYYLQNDGSFSLSNAKNDADIDMELAWEIETGDTSITVAILDSGLKLDHPEFEGRIWTNGKEELNGIDDDGNGYIDDIEGWDFVNTDNDPTDDHGHGTNVTGIIGASSNNSRGYAGMDWNCKLMICKVINESNFGYYSWWADAIYYAVDNGADVINMSLGGSGSSKLLQDAVDYAYSKGVVVVACTMNTNVGTPFYPAGFPNAIAVGATNPDDSRSVPFFWDAESGSNYGPHVDVVAPGNYIYGLSYNSNTNYGSYWGGTSQAAPQVAALSSLLLAQNPQRTPDDIRSIIRSTAEDQVGNPDEDTEGFDQYYGYGRINANMALQSQITSVVGTITKPKVSIYPNPNQGTFFVKGLIAGQRIRVLNFLGAEIYNEEVRQNADLKQLNLGSLGSGMVHVQVINKEGHAFQSETLLIQ